jgi:hypothetical protein
MIRWCPFSASHRGSRAGRFRQGRVRRLRSRHADSAKRAAPRLAASTDDGGARSGIEAPVRECDARGKAVVSVRWGDLREDPSYTEPQ